MKNLNSTILFLALFITSFTSFAQSGWIQLPNNGFIISSRIEDIYFTDTLTAYAVTLNNKLYKTIDGGKNWTLNNNHNYSQFRAIEFLDDGAIGLTGALNISPSVHLTTDTGKTWTDISNKINDSTSKAKQICGIAHYDSTFYAVGSWSSDTAKFYKSFDKGNTWSTYYFDTNQATSLVDVVFISHDTGFVCGAIANYTKRNFHSSVILKTTDGGKTWTTVFSDTVYAGYIWKLQVVTQDYMVGSVQNQYERDSVFMVRSNNRGNNWEIIKVADKSNLGIHTGFTQACGFRTPANGWVGGYYHGIYETTDSGKTWKHINFGENFNRIFVIDSNHIYAGGIFPYKYHIDTSLSIPFLYHKNTELHTIKPVIPNPAKDKITIDFSLYNSTNIVLNVIHIDSRRVFKITNDYLSKGDYSYQWDATNAPAGNYLIWLGTNEIPITQKFVLLK